MCFKFFKQCFTQKIKKPQTLFVILLEVAIRKWVHGSPEGMDVVSNSTQVGCSIQMKLSWYQGAQSVEIVSHHYTNNSMIHFSPYSQLIHTFMSFTPKSDTTIWISLQTSGPVNIFPLYCFCVWIGEWAMLYKLLRVLKYSRKTPSPFTWAGLTR